MNFWKRNISLSQKQEEREASKIATWLDRLTNDKECHFDPFGKNNPTFDKLAERIASQAGITPSHNNTDCRNNHFMPDLPPRLLAWNKNPQCPPDIWEKISVPLVPTSKKPFKGLAVQRHSKVKSTLDNINYIELSFSINNDIDLGYGFWLIDDQYKDFVYAILKSSMFRAWCKLTAHTDGGEGHFTVGMWDTFPIQDIEKPLSQLGNLSSEIRNLFAKTPTVKTVEEAIKQAGQWRKNGWKQSVSFDECMDELCGFGHLPSDCSTLSRLSISRTSMPLSGSVVTDFLNKDIAKVIELAEKNVPDDFEERIDKLYGFDNLSNIKLSELPKPLSDDVKDLFKSERDIDVKKAIKLAGEWQKNGWKKNNRRTLKSDFKKCMTELCSLPLVTYSLRIQILAEGFLDAFYGV